MGLPHFSQVSLETSGSTGVRPSFAREAMYLHSGKPEQERNLPRRPSFTTRGRSHSGQVPVVASVVTSDLLTSPSFWCSSSEKGPQKSRSSGFHCSSPRET